MSHCRMSRSTSGITGTARACAAGAEVQPPRFELSRWFGAAVGGDMVWSFNPGDASPVPPRSGWKVPFEGDVDPNLVVTLSNGAAVEVGAETHIRVQGCSHPIVSPIVNGSFVRSSENHGAGPWSHSHSLLRGGKPVYKKTVQTKDKVDVLIYFWDDVQNPTFCGWWFGPEVGAEQVWAYNSSPAPSSEALREA